MGGLIVAGVIYATFMNGNKMWREARMLAWNWPRSWYDLYLV